MNMKRMIIGWIVPIFLMLCACSEQEVYLLSEEMQEENVAESEEMIALPSTDTTENVCVHICGAVNSPGVYILPAGSRLYEAVETAGGFVADADDKAVNLARILRDGEQIDIPKLSEQRENATNQEGKVNINKADLDEFMSVPGIGEVRAQAILNYREENGSFINIEDLLNVPGIKQGIYDKIEPFIYCE